MHRYVLLLYFHPVSYTHLDVYKRQVMDVKYEYSYSDGDQWYQWSPDSKWILTNYIGCLLYTSQTYLLSTLSN